MQYLQSCPRVHWFNIRGFSYPRFTAARKKLEKLRNKCFISFKTRAKRERAVTWWNTPAQIRPVLYSSSFVPLPALPRWSCRHFAFIFLAVRISCRVVAVFVFRKPLFTVTMVPMGKSIDAGSVSKPKRSRDVLSISEKVKILDMIEV